MISKTNTNAHEHITETGDTVKCYHPVVDLFRSWKFWMGITLGYPFEHFLWTHVYPFNIIGELLIGH